MKLPIRIFVDEDGMFVAECTAVPGCVSQGKSEAQARNNIRDAIRECLQVRDQLGLPQTVLPPEEENLL